MKGAKFLLYHLQDMRFGAAILLACRLVLVATAASGGDTDDSESGGFFTQYEYEEEMYLSLDRSATLYVNSSIPALNALRGTTFDERPNARVDRAAVRRYFTSPATRVTRVTSTRRNNRTYVHVRLETDDFLQLPAAAPFAWSSYRFSRDGELFSYRQSVGAAAAAAALYEGWSGREIVAFRIHVPSRVEYHNAGADNLQRGNILVWEQRLADRLRGAPLTLEARMHSQSILYRTLWLFGATAVAVAAMFGGIIWWLVRRGPRTAAPAGAGR